MFTKKNINIYDSETKRFIKKGNKYKQIHSSPNCGLLCYLAESLLNAGLNHPKETDLIKLSINKLFDEAQIYNNKYFWGWEKKSTIKNVFFPLDWDDTSKAIDFLSIAQRKGFVTNNEIMLPGNNLWESEIVKSLFYSDSFGEDIKVDLKNNLGISVFFGPESDKWVKRNDPMVTISLIRTTILWYPTVYNNLKNEFIEMLNKLTFIAAYLMENKIHFWYISRYYYSFGHFVYRLLETYDLLKTSPQNNLIDQIKTKVRDNISTINISSKKHFHYDDLFWVLIAVKTKLINDQELSELLPLLGSIKDNSFVYRHRRLNHYYLSTHWYENLIYYELNGQKFPNLSKIFNYKSVLKESNKYKKVV